MYREHQVFEKPSDENAKIWRYLDFTKFVSLLDKQALFFGKADKLGDPFEGSYPKANILHRCESYKSLPIETMSEARRYIRTLTVVNCWHINEHESAAMWKLYLKSDEGVAIQSTFKGLTESFSNFNEDVFIGKVKYIDYRTDLIPENNAFYPFLYKRKSFEHEQELRAVVLHLPPKEGEIDPQPIDIGIYVPTDLKTLVHKIFLSPTAPPWFSELVKSVVDKYGLGKEVSQSTLAEDPLF